MFFVTCAQKHIQLCAVANIVYEHFVNHY